MLHTTHPASFTPHILQAFMLHTTRPARFTPHFLEADFASHHSSCKPTCFTPLVLRASHHTSCRPILLHTTRTAGPQASHHMSCELHTTRPVSRFCYTPHVLQAYMLHTTHPASFTPLVLQADFASHHPGCNSCVTDRDPGIAPVLRVRCPVPETLCKLHPTPFESQSY